MKNLILIIGLTCFITSCGTFNSTYYNSALNEYNNGNYQSALFYLDEILKENENVFEALVLRSKVYLKLGNKDLAENDLQKALLLNEDYESHFIIAKIALDKNDYQTSLYHLDRAISLQTQFIEGYLNRAYVYYQIGDYDKSLDDYKKAYELNPQNSIPLTNIGFIYGLIGQNDIAMEYYTRAISINPNDFNAYYNRANEFLMKRKNQEALNDLLSAYELNKHNIELLFLIAETRIKMKDYQNAFNDYTKILFIDSLNSKAYYQRALVNIELKREKSACEDFTKAGSLGYFDAYEQIRKYCVKKSSSKKKK